MNKRTSLELCSKEVIKRNIMIGKNEIETILLMTTGTALMEYMEEYTGRIKSEQAIEERFLDEKATLQKLKIGKSTLAKFRREGILSYYTITPKSFLYDLNEINELIESKKVSKF
jgi:hypothetical protein